MFYNLFIGQIFAYLQKPNIELLMFSYNIFYCECLDPKESPILDKINFIVPNCYFGIGCVSWRPAHFTNHV